MDRFKKLRPYFILLLIGAVAGPILDGFHTWGGALRYPDELFLKTAWWTPFLFSMAVLALGAGHVECDGAFKRKPKPRTWTEIYAGIGLFVLTYGISGLWTVDYTVKTVAMTGLAILTWFLFDRTCLGVFQALATAGIGCTFESFLSSTGAFEYISPNFARIPLWLAPLYFCASVSVGNLGRKLLPPVPR